MINLQCKHTWMVRFTNGNIQVHLVGTFRFAIDFIKMVFFFGIVFIFCFLYISTSYFGVYKMAAI